MTCFAASYLVALGLEVSRLFFRLPVRTAVAIGMAIAGLFAHTVYLVLQVDETAAASMSFASWYHWCLMAAWVLAAIYVGSALSHPKAAIGLFMLPVVLLLVALAIPARGATGGFPKDGFAPWAALHGILMLLGTVTVSLGFVAGLMYLVQSYRLKHRMPPRPGLRLPSLEWLGRFNGQAVIVSTALCAGGLLSGVLLNLGKGDLPWSDPAVVFLAGLVVWMLIACGVELGFRGATQNGKMVYLTLATFVIVLLVLGTLLFGPSGHAGSPARQTAARQDAPTGKDGAEKPPPYGDVQQTPRGRKSP